VTDRERHEDLGEAPQQREEAHPEQNQGRPLGQRIHPIRPDTQNATSTSRIPVTSWTHQYGFNGREATPWMMSKVP
jgi:hypothetical protein